MATAWDRFFARSFRVIDAECTDTVRGEMPKISAVLLADFPCTR
jgi:hypothetical protein